MAKRLTHQLAYRAIRIEGGLIPAEELTRLTLLTDPKGTEQTESHYRIAKGLKLRDEIARDFKIALNLWQDFQALRQRQDVRTHEVTVREWLLPLLRDVLHFHDAARCPAIQKAGHQYAVGHAGNGGRVPLVFAGFDEPLDAAAERFGETNPDTGKTRRRSPFMLAQEALNASDESLWAIVSNGLTLRILRDNASLTRPAYIEVDLEALFNEELLADFSAFWLLAHATRFGTAETQPKDCTWERWRNAALEVGDTVRGALRKNVTAALRALGTGFISHPANVALRSALMTTEDSYDRQAFFEELLRLVYRLIFLATVEDRRDRSTGERLVFTPDAADDAKARYLAGYSMTWLRERAVRRSQHDRHADLWQALTITFGALAHGEPALGLPALGGLFDTDQCPRLDAAQLDNRHLLAAIFQLGWFRADGGLSRVNYRDMGPEELGSVYESLLELVPELQGLASPATARLAFVGDDESDGSTKGNNRKLTGSYYTPDSLVQELIKSTLEPVIAQTVRSNPVRPVDALLSLTVCDPACGSGHFLLSAARRLADEVALHRAAGEREGGAPTPLDYRHALRDVVSHCIYGVDRNPMAIALAKTALWLEAYTPDRPLTFLDAHLRCGDALLGILDEQLLHEGIPDKAYSLLTGDDDEVVKRVKKANREALKSIQREEENSQRMMRLDFVNSSEAIAFEALPDDTLGQIQAKQAAYAQLEARIATSRVRLAADIFVAAFLLPKTADIEPNLPTSQDLWLVLNGDNPRPDVTKAALSAASAAQAFHWWQAFPQIKERGGFSVILGNPPWDQLQFRDQEFFASRAPSVASASTTNQRERLIKALAASNPVLYKEYLLALRTSESARLFAQGSGRFPLAGVGRSNTYALFAESTKGLVCNLGRAGLIVPSGLATDDTTKSLFEDFVFSSMLLSFYDFENRKGIFADIDSRTKFALVTLAGAKTMSQDSKASFVFYAHQPDDIYDQRRLLKLGAEDFGALNPNTRTACTFRTSVDAEITIKAHRAYPILVNEASPSASSWKLSTRPGLFNMSGHSDKFRGQEELLARGFELSGNSFVKGDERWLPLYEGKMVGMYDHRAADVVISTTAQLRQGQSEALSDEAHKDRSRLPIPRHWILEEEVNLAVGDTWKKKWIIGWKEITSPTNERTLIPAVLPLVGVGHKIPIFVIDPTQVNLAGCFLANLSSIFVDFIVRQKLGTTSLTPFTVKQLPVIPPERYSTGDMGYIFPRVLELTYTSHDLKPWAEELGYHDSPFEWNPERRAVLQSELDAYYARLYRLTRDELRYVLDPKDVMGEDYPSETFRVLKDGEIRAYGEYRTRRLVLEAWDRLNTQIG